MQKSDLLTLFGSKGEDILSSTLQPAGTRVILLSSMAGRSSFSSSEGDETESGGASLSNKDKSWSASKSSSGSRKAMESLEERRCEERLADEKSRKSSKE